MSLPENRDQLRQRWEAGERFEFHFFYGHQPPQTGVDSSCLSQWFVRVFEVEGIGYPTAEHWMMAEKARVFADEAMLAEILAAKGPREAKALGRKVSGFDNETWGLHRFEIVKRGNHAKFSQHDDLKQFLLSTSRAEQSPDYRAVAESGEAYDVDEKQDPVADEQVSEPLKLYQVPDQETIDPHGGQSDQRQPASSPSNVILVEAAPRDAIWGIGLGKKNPKAQDPLTWRGWNLLGFALTAVREQLREEQ